MRRTFNLLAAALFLVLTPSRARAQDKPQDRFLTSHAFKQKAKTPLACQYLLFLPQDYAARVKAAGPGERELTVAERWSATQDCGAVLTAQNEF